MTEALTIWTLLLAACLAAGLVMAVRTPAAGRATPAGRQVLVSAGTRFSGNVRGAWVAGACLGLLGVAQASDFSHASFTMAGMQPPRVSLIGFPDVVILADESVVKRHPKFPAAKSGDILAANEVVLELVTQPGIDKVAGLVAGYAVELAPIHALETDGVNEIPAALARLLADRLNLQVSDSIVQSNTVGHTGADGFHRLANQASFSGAVVSGRSYLVVDDFVGQGGTLANLIGFIKSQGAQVVGALVLTGKPFSAKLAPEDLQIQSLRQKHGHDLEQWWQENFGFDFDRLTRSEARYLENSPDAKTIRDRITAARLEGGTVL